MTAEEIRRRIIEVVLKNGGHLASSLGAVELSMALADAFDPEKDRVVWDVGHQAYAWKILTGRNESFGTLRQMGGVGPFPSPAESSADAAVAGHAGVSISVAAGLAAARSAQGEAGHVVAVIGDASLANGTALEAVVNLSAMAEKLVVVLNNNEARGRFFKGRFFRHFGLGYIGPVDGHDLGRLKDAFAAAKEEKGSVVVHVVTRKGMGYAPAEGDPTAYHGVPEEGRVPAPGWSDAFGDALCRMAREDGRIVALTAAMKEGTGLAPFAEEFPCRFFDVGIAEGHMVAFAAGLAAGGMRPVVAVYSTFLQRAVDQVMHDVCIANLPVVVCVDRAGVVGADGATHQGVFDIAMLRCLPNLSIAQPCDGDDLARLLSEAVGRGGPVVLRYPRGALPAPSGLAVPRGALAVEAANPGAKVQIWATGDRLATALEVAGRTGAGVVFARWLKPFDETLLLRQRAAGCRIVSMENGVAAGGFGEAIGADARFGWPDEFVPHGRVDELERRYGQDAEAVAEAVRGMM